MASGASGLITQCLKEDGKGNYIMVKAENADGDEDVFKVLISADGFVKVVDLQAKLPGATGLKYRKQESPSFKDVDFERKGFSPPPPKYKWNDPERTYVATYEVVEPQSGTDGRKCHQD